MGLTEELEEIAAIAIGFAEAGEQLAAILPTEPGPGRRVYLCAYRRGEEDRTWLALDAAGRPLDRRVDLREAVSISALCELAEETAGGGQLDELRSQLAALRITENPPGIEEADEAVQELERRIGSPPSLATPERLDEIGEATRRLERALGDEARSPFADAMKLAVGVVEALTAEVESRYKRVLQ